MDSCRANYDLTQLQKGRAEIQTLPLCQPSQAQFSFKVLQAFPERLQQERKLRYFLLRVWLEPLPSHLFLGCLKQDSEGARRWWCAGHLVPPSPSPHLLTFSRSVSHALVVISFALAGGISGQVLDDIQRPEPLCS